MEQKTADPGREPAWADEDEPSELFRIVKREVQRDIASHRASVDHGALKP